MHYRPLGTTGIDVSAVGFGAWAIGGGWGAVDDAASVRALHAAVDAGVNFIDTADVYGDGHSERLVAQVRRERPGDRLWVATKAGRRLPSQSPEGYDRARLTAWIEHKRGRDAHDAPGLCKLRLIISVDLNDFQLFTEHIRHLFDGRALNGLTRDTIRCCEIDEHRLVR